MQSTAIHSPLNSLVSETLDETITRLDRWTYAIAFIIMKRQLRQRWPATP